MAGMKQRMRSGKSAVKNPGKLLTRLMKYEIGRAHV